MGLEGRTGLDKPDYLGDMVAGLGLWHDRAAEWAIAKEAAKWR